MLLSGERLGKSCRYGLVVDCYSILYSIAYIHAHAAMKLSPSGIEKFLRSPKAFYWQYLYKLDGTDTLGIEPSDYYSIHLVLGGIWSAFIHNFYQGMPEEENREIARQAWAQATMYDPDTKKVQTYTQALEAWMLYYYGSCSPDDGIRTKERSELWVENDRFCGILDGMSADGIIHEVKTAGVSGSMEAQEWKVRNSVQVQLYAVVTDAEGVMIEHAFKHSPFKIRRGQTYLFTPAQKRQWRAELDELHDRIHNTAAFVCNPAGCCEFMSNLCPYARLCEGDMSALSSFSAKKPRKVGEHA